MSRDLPKEMFHSWRGQIRKSRRAEEAHPRQRHEDPLQVGSVLHELAEQNDWRQGIAEGTLFTEWEAVVGEEIGSHSTPTSLVDGRLTIQTTSTAWATQLNAISTQLLATIRSSAPGALVDEIIVIGPGAPSWKKGLRTIRGARGPRDTYG